MAIECGVITAILLAMAVIFFTRRHKEWGWATLPLTLVPMTEFVMVTLFAYVLKFQISIYWGVFALVVAVAISCAWVGFAANGLKNNSTKAMYISIANGFNVLLAAILINNILDVVGTISSALGL